MKSTATALVASTLFALVMFCLANFSFGQGGQGLGVPVREESHPQDFVPTLGQTGPANPEPTPDHHDVTETHGETDLGTQPTPSGDTETLYDKNAAPKAAANGFETEHRGKITHGKRQEQIVVSESSKPVKIEQTKDGSSDATVSTGRFKDSLLDVAIGGGPTINAEPQPKAVQRPTQQKQRHPAAAAPVKPEPAASPEPMTHSAQAPDDSRFGLDLGVASAKPSPSASPAPQ